MYIYYILYDYYYITIIWHTDWFQLCNILEKETTDTYMYMYVAFSDFH